MKNKFKMEQKLRDKVTGFEGIVLCISWYHTGCIHYSLQSEILRVDGTPGEWQCFDESRLALVKDAIAKKNKPMGGSFPDPKQMG